MFMLRNKLILIMTVFFLVILLLSTAYKADVNRDRLARFRERDLQMKAAYELGCEIADRMSLAMKAHMTLDEFQEKFGPVSSLEGDAAKEHKGKTHLFFHKKSQRKFYLRFENDGLLGRASSHGNSDIDTGVVLESEEYVMSEHVRNAALLFSLLVWCVTLVLSLFLKTIPNIAAAVLMFTSITSGLCLFLSPAYTPTFHGMLRNDSLAFFIPMFIISIVFCFCSVSSKVPSSK